MGVVARFRHGVAAVEFDEEIVIVTAEHEIDRACLENRVVLTAAGMDHRHDEISPFTSQRLGCILRGRDRRQEFQIFGARRARGVVVGRASQPDAHAVDGRDGAVLEVRQRSAIGAAQVGGVAREFGLCHALEEGRLAEIELVVARHEHVERDHVAERDDVGAAVDPRHQRGRDGVAAMGEDDVAALGALGLDDGRKPRETAAALAVGHHLVAHQIDIVDEEESDPRGLGNGRAGEEDRGEVDEEDGGKAADGKSGHVMVYSAPVGAARSPRAGGA